MVAQLIVMFIHYVVYATVVKYFGIYSTNVLWGFRSLMFLASISFFASALMTYNFWSFWGHVFYTSASVWLGLVIWLFFASVILVIGDQILQLFKMSDLLYWGLRGTLALLCFAGAVGVNLYGLVHQSDIKVARYTVTLPNLPASWDGRRAVMFADTHYGNVFSGDSARNIAGLILSLKPDIVFMPGDFYDGPPMDYASPARVFKLMIRDLKEEQQNFLGAFYVTGNHEEYRERTTYLEPLKAAGFNILDNQEVRVDGVVISGVSYKDSINEDVFNKTMASSSVSMSDAPKILLKHVPDGLNTAIKYGADLMLSGHTHRGQMWPFSLIAKFIFKGYDYGQNVFVPENNSSNSNDAKSSSASIYSDGYFKKGSYMTVITTSGAGTWGPPQRIGTDTEIVEITFRKK